MSNERNEVRLLRIEIQRLENRLNKVCNQLTVRAEKDESAAEQNDSSEFLDVYDVARIFHVSPQTVYNWRYRKTIPFVKAEGRLLFRRKDVIGYFEKRNMKNKKRN